MEVSVKFYATLRDHLTQSKRQELEEKGELNIEIEPGNTVGDLLARMNIPEEEVKMIFVDNRRQKPDYSLQSGDNVAVFPPIAGG
ncbi:MoaD/ThiS family protein [Halarsenatibacter silvermanii]|uniref:Molybdopterin converting factor, small subunit n=1 Tax=Halarsenatibacter silvermanii TaxID=321763 RepID=A0A1G9SMY7_9FIRM|nr:MoaD/ThiS family protein [Halarsenatibacter silvermanii]SDM36809.1 Molybdopterin converting factor, small subunit [Halarsenatibacter silvermanii]